MHFLYENDSIHFDTLVYNWVISSWDPENPEMSSISCFSALRKRSLSSVLYYKMQSEAIKLNSDKLCYVPNLKELQENKSISI